MLDPGFNKKQIIIFYSLKGETAWSTYSPRITMMPLSKRLHTADHSWMNRGYVAKQEQVVEEWDENAAGHSLK